MLHRFNLPSPHSDIRTGYPLKQCTYPLKPGMQDYKIYMNIVFWGERQHDLPGLIDNATGQRKRKMCRQTQTSAISDDYFVSFAVPQANVSNLNSICATRMFAWLQKWTLKSGTVQSTSQPQSDLSVDCSVLSTFLFLYISYIVLYYHSPYCLNWQQ